MRVSDAVRQVFHTTHETTLNRAVVPTEHGLLREVNGNLLSNGDVGE